MRRRVVNCSLHSSHSCESGDVITASMKRNIILGLLLLTTYTFALGDAQACSGSFEEYSEVRSNASVEVIEEVADVAEAVFPGVDVTMTPDGAVDERALYSELATQYSVTETDSGYTKFQEALSEITEAYFEACYGPEESRPRLEEVPIHIQAYATLIAEDILDIHQIRQEFGTLTCLHVESDPPSSSYDCSGGLSGASTTEELFSCLDTDGVKPIFGFQDTIDELAADACLAFVVDDTGSMSDEIDAVRNLILMFLASEEDEPVCYILVPFNDYGSAETSYGPVTVYDPTLLSGDGSLLSFQAAVNALYAHGGGDCPEYGMIAILAALDKLEELNGGAHSHIIVLTDASAKDDFSYTNVINRANELGTTVHLFLSGTYGCGTNFGHYTDIADATGGIVVRSITDFDAFTTFINLFTTSSSSSSRRKRTVLGDEAPCHDITISLFTTSLEVLISTLQSQFIVTDPSGIATTYSKPGTLYLFSVESPQAGQWMFCVSSGVLAISVSAPVTVDFFVSYVVESDGELLPSTLIPSACSMQNVIVTTSQFSSISSMLPLYLDLVNSDGVVMQEVPLTRCTELYTGSVTFPAFETRYRLRGSDTHENDFQYTNSERVNFLSPGISVPSENNFGLHPGQTVQETLVFQYLVSSGPANTFSFSAITPSGISATFQTSATTVLPNNNFTVVVLFTASSLVERGTVHNITISINDTCSESTSAVQLQAFVYYFLSANIANITGSSFSIQWVPPEGGTVLSFTLYIDFTNGTTTVITTAGSASSYLLEGLFPNQTVTVDISATTLAGETAKTSFPRVVTTKAALPSPPPVNVVVTAVGTTTATLTWEAPDVGDEILKTPESYCIRCTEVQFGLPDIVANTGDTTYTFSSLEEYNNYSCTLVGVNAAGSGSYSTAVFIQTQEDVPSGAPRNASGYPVSSTLIRVTWTPPLPTDVNGRIDFYMVMVTEAQTGRMFNLHAVDDHIIFGPTHPYYDYQFKVAAFTIGIGPYTDDFIITGGEDVPTSSPQNLTVSAVDASSVSLEWNQPPIEHQNGLIRLYRVLVTEVETGRFIETTSNSTKITVSNLLPYYNYTSVVAAETIAIGPYTFPVSFTLPEETPDAPPQNVTGTVLSSSSILLTWNLPPLYERNGIIVSYLIDMTELDTGNVVQSSSVYTYITIYSLHPYYTYECRVSALTVIGPGPFSSGIVLQTFTDVPNAPPENFTAIPLSPLSIYLTWEPPSPENRNGEISNYIINITAVERDSMFELFSATNSLVVNSLTPFTTYNCVIAAINYAGTGPFSTSIVVNTPEDVPSPPLQPNATTVVGSPTELYLTWSIPERPNGNIRSYTIYCYKAETPSEVSSGDGESSILLPEDSLDSSVAATASVHGSQRQGIVSGLLPYTVYECYVTASTTVEGNTSTVSSARTDESVPGDAPQGFVASVINATAILLAWSPPQVPNGIITTYVIAHNGSFEITLISSVESFVVNELNEYTWYQFEVYSQTRIGPGPSAYTVERTNIAKPFSPPSDLEVSVTGSTTALVFWLPPAADDQNGPILYYELIIREQGFNLPDQIVNVTATSYTLSGLEEYDNYSCNIAAATDAGLGPSSEAVLFTTYQAIPSAPPQSLAGTVHSSTTIEFSWNPPPAIDINGLIQYYLVRLTEIETERFWRFFAVDPDIIIGSLHPYYNYECQVAAYTIGIGPFTEKYFIQTEEAAPSASPSNLLAAVVTSTSFILSWEPPPAEETNGVIRQYLISVTETETGQMFTKMTNSTQVFLNGFHPFYTYACTVAAETVALSANSLPYLVQLEEEAPSAAPLHTFGYAIDSTSIFLSWNPPPSEHRNGIIRQYIINVTVQDTGNVFLLTTTATEFTLQALHPYYTYAITITAVTISPGPPSNTFLIQTEEDNPSAAPLDFAVSVETAQSISLVWEPPAADSQNGIIIGYIVNVTSEQTSEYFQFTSPDNSLVIDSLRPFTTYMCTVAGLTSAGVGPFSITISVQTEESAPSAAPEYFTVVPISSTAITLTWSPPPVENQNGIIREYRINITEVETGTVTILLSTTTTISLSPLHPYYTYQCIVSAYTVDVGPYTEIFTVVTLEDVPSGYPQNFEALAITSRSVSLIWNPPLLHQQNGIIMGYLINVTAVETGEVFQLSSNTTSLTVNEFIRPFTTYLCIIAARTTVGTGPYSTVFNLQTPEDVPSSPPQTPSGTAINSVTILLSWSPPPVLHQNGIIREYRINLTEVETGVVTYLAHNGSATSIEISSLHPYYIYTWSVAAFTIGIGPYSEESSVRTLQDVPSGFPQNFIGHSVGSRNITLSWTPPPYDQHNGIIIGYLVSISSVDPGEHQQLVTASQNVSVSGLNPHTAYACLITAGTSIGYGPYSMEIIIVTTEEAPTGSPLNVTGEAINSTHIYLQWDPPPEDQQLGDIIGYRINVTELETGLTFQLQTGITSIVIESLHPYYTYRCNIVAYTSVGDGPYSTHIAVRTHEDVPTSSPQSFQARTEGSMEIFLSWESPEFQHQNGIIRQYVVTVISEEEETITATSMMLSITIYSLRPYTSYSCTVRAETIGIGPPTEEMTVLTDEDAPSEPPGSVAANALGSRSLSLTWQPPSQEGRNGIIRQYTVIITEILTGNVLQFMTNDTTITVESLRPFYTYSCVVAAETIALGPFSSPVAVEMPEDAPSSPPTSLSVSEVTSTSFLLSWNSPPTEDRNGLIRHYIINITEENSGRMFQETSQTTEKAIEFLHPHYNYTCTIAAVTVATGPYSSSLVVLTSEDNPSGAPVNFEAMPLSSTSVIITWEPPPLEEQNGGIIGYVINVTISESGEEFQLYSTENSYTLNNLRPFTTYICVIAAESVQGLGPFSTITTVRTLQASPSSPPTLVSHVQVTSTFIQIMWSPPPPDQHNGIIVTYIVMISEVETQRTFSINATATELAVSDLHPFYNYHFAVAAVTVDVGPFTSLYSLQTLEDVPSAPPQNFAADPIDSRTLGLEWNPPPPQYHNGIIREYQINVTVSDDGEQFQLTSNTTQLRVNNLHPYYTYTCLIAAVTIGAGPFSEVYTIQMPEDAPTAPPQSLAGEVLSSTTISITWLPPVSEQQNGFIRFYTISIHELPTSQTFTFQRAGHHTILVVDTLHPYYEYELTVAAETIALGPFTTSITLQTNEDVPSSPPLALQGSAVDSKTIQLSWQPPLPEDQNGVIRSYLINVKEEETDETYQLSSDTQSITASGLHPYYTYTFTIAAVTIGPGPFSSGQTIRTPEDVPNGAPQEFQAEAVSSSSIRLKWKAPLEEEQNGVIRSYLVTVLEVESGEMSSYERDEKDTLFIINSLHPFYNYNCTIAAITIDLGPAAFASIQTEPEVPSDVPQNVMAMYNNATSVTVSWDPPPPEHINGIIVQYIIQVSVTNTNEEFEEYSNDITATLFNLHPFYTYKIIVAAETVAVGPFSSVTSVTTPEAVPTATIQSIMITSLSPTSVRISWLPSDIQYWNGIITRYSLVYRLLGTVDSYTEVSEHDPYPEQIVSIPQPGLTLNNDPNPATVNLPLQQETLSIQDLEEYSLYQFYLYFENSVGKSDNSELYVQEMPQSVPTGPPTYVEVMVLSSTSVLIKWQPPELFDRNGIITGYNISLTLEGKESVVISVSASSLSYSVEGIDKYSDVIVFVAARTTIGTGPYSESVIVKTSEDVPDAPKDVVVRVLNNTAVELNWTAPDGKNGIIVGYQVIYYGYKEPQDGMKIQPNLIEGPFHVDVSRGDQLTIIISDLTPAYIYNFMIRARTKAGYGGNSSAITVNLDVITDKGGSTGGGISGIVVAIAIVAVIAVLGWILLIILVAACIWRKKKFRSFIFSRHSRKPTVVAHNAGENTYESAEYYRNENAEQRGIEIEIDLDGDTSNDQGLDHKDGSISDQESTSL